MKSLTKETNREAGNGDKEYVCEAVCFFSLQMHKKTKNQTCFWGTLRTSAALCMSLRIVWSQGFVFYYENIFKLSFPKHETSNLVLSEASSKTAIDFHVGEGKFVPKSIYHLMLVFCIVIQNKVFWIKYLSPCLLAYLTVPPKGKETARKNL